MKCGHSCDDLVVKEVSLKLLAGSIIPTIEVPQLDPATVKEIKYGILGALLTGLFYAPLAYCTFTEISKYFDG